MFRYTFPAVICFALIETVLIDNHAYCSIRYKRLCQGKGQHVACRFPNEWSRELAFLAQRFADQCHFVHDECRATVRYPYAGQTVGEVRWKRYQHLGDSEEQSAQRAIRLVLDAWWGEKRRVEPSQLTQPFRLTTRRTVWGDFSQLAVWSLQAMGCGAVRHGKDKPRLLLVCDYSHTNMLGQKTITPGAISPCPIHTARRPRSSYPLLCAPVRHRATTDSDLIGDSELKESIFQSQAQIREDEISYEKKNFKNIKEKTLEKIYARNNSDGFFFEDELPESNYRAEDVTENQMAYKIPTTEIKIQQKLEEDLWNYERKNKNIYAINTDAPDRFEKSKYFGKWREMENIEDTPFVVTRRYMMATRSLNGHKTKQEDESKTETHVRRKWKQTQNRPKRPGAEALFKTILLTHGRVSSIGALKLDKDDLEQLFQDTGFSWKES